MQQANPSTTATQKNTTAVNSQAASSTVTQAAAKRTVSKAVEQSTVNSHASDLASYTRIEALFNKCLSRLDDKQINFCQVTQSHILFFQHLKVRLQRNARPLFWRAVLR